MKENLKGAGMKQERQLKERLEKQRGTDIMRKALIMTAILIMCLTLCTACKPKVVGVKSLAAANIAAQSKVENYHMDADVDIVVTLDAGELRDLLKPADPKLPVKMTMDADAGVNTAHVTTKASVSVMGQSVDVQESELYMDMANGASYTKAGESRKWEKKEYADKEMGFGDLVSGIALVGKTVLKNADFSESEEFYSLAMPADKAGDLIKDLELLESVELGIADVRDITVEGGQIIYNVDKETLLVSSIELKDVDIRGKGTYKEVSVDLKFPTSGVFRFSRYNELEESEYAIPAEVMGS